MWELLSKHIYAKDYKIITCKYLCDIRKNFVINKLILNKVLYNNISVIKYNVIK